MRMIELFAGIGATREAIKEVGINFEAVAISEIEPNAIRGYEAIHGKTDNLGDITKIEKLPAADLITYSYPCQSVSIAGKQEGMKEGSGTTSSLVWEECPDGRVLRDVLESDVDDSYYLSDDRIKTFISHKERNDAKGNGFGFKIRDLDKPSVAVTTQADRYCSNWVASPKLELAGKLSMPGWDDFSNRVYLDIGASPALNTRGDASRGPKIISAGRLDSGSRFNSATNVYDVDGIAPTLTTTHPGIGVHKIETIDYEKIRIRYLTPRECLRLQAFPDSAIDALLKEIQSKTQLYKLAGNSIPVCVLRAIFESIYLKRSFTNESDRQVSLNNWGVLI